MPIIEIEWHDLDALFQVPEGLSRSQHIAFRQQAIAQFRSQRLASRLQYEIQSTDFAKTVYGKPYLTHFPQFYFNHSHTQHCYALATSFNVPNLGVDIEELNRKVRFAALAAHAFHPEEIQRWHDSGQDPIYWFKVWTTKEAVLKASGLGIRLNLKEFNTQVSIQQDDGYCHHPLIGHFYYRSYRLDAVMLSIAWQAEHDEKRPVFPEIYIHHGA